MPENPTHTRLLAHIIGSIHQDMPVSRVTEIYNAALNAREQLIELLRGRVGEDDPELVAASIIRCADYCRRTTEPQPKDMKVILLRVWSMMLLVGIALFCCGVFSAWAADDLYLGIAKGINYWCGLVMLNLATVGAWLGYRMARPNP